MGRKSQDQKEQDLIQEALKRLKLAATADSQNRTDAVADLRFINVSQWSDEEKKRRKDKGRPALTINFLNKFVNQVVGDMLHNTPAIKFVPTDSQADAHAAMLRQGIVSDIQYQSAASEIYDYAATHLVQCGYGAWRVLTRYTEENPFIQEIYLETVKNALLVFLDPTAKSKYFADAGWGLLLEKISVDEFKDRYPDAQVPGTRVMGPMVGLALENWYTQDTVTVAEYFRRDSEKKTMVQLEDGRVIAKEDFALIHKEWEERQDELLAKLPQMAASSSPAAPAAPPGPVPPSTPTTPAPPAAPLPAGASAPVAAGPPAPQKPNPALMLGAQFSQQMQALGPEPKIAKERETDSTVIRHWILTCNDILKGGLEGDRVAGKYIPLVLARGPEVNVEGRTIVTSLTRHAKDAQKMANYWQSSAAETIALAPKSPWLATAAQIEGHEAAYAAANVENNPFLLYNVDPLAPGPPQRIQPPAPPVAIFEQIRRSEEDIKSVIGLFGADLGQPGSEQTGAAITARQKPGDIGTYAFAKILVGAVEHTGRIINEMIPEVYDSERDIRVRRLDESESFVPVNTTVDTAIDKLKQNPKRYQGLKLKELQTIYSRHGKDTKFNDLTVGKFNVRATAGPSYATQRQESAQHLLQLVQAMPSQMAIAADLIVENLDFKAATELASRLRRPLVAQGITAPREGEPEPKPIPPPPKVQIEQIKLQGAVQLAQLKVQHAQLELEIEKIKAQTALITAQSGGKHPADIQDDQFKAMLSAKRLQLDTAQFQHKQAVDAAQIDVSRQKIAGDIAGKVLQHSVAMQQQGGD